MLATMCRVIAGVVATVLIVLVSGLWGQAQTLEIDALRPRAVQGDAWAQYDLGQIFADGRDFRRRDFRRSDHGRPMGNFMAPRSEAA